MALRVSRRRWCGCAGWGVRSHGRVKVEMFENSGVAPLFFLRSSALLVLVLDNKLLVHKPLVSKPVVSKPIPPNRRFHRTAVWVDWAVR